MEGACLVSRAYCHFLYDFVSEERVHLPEFSEGFYSHCHVYRAMRDVGIIGWLAGI